MCRCDIIAALRRFPSAGYWCAVHRVGLRQNSFKPAAFFCSDVAVRAQDILAWVIARWNIEVAFEELRAFFGFETQRQWSDRAIERTTPCLPEGASSAWSSWPKCFIQTACQFARQSGIPKTKPHSATFWQPSAVIYRVDAAHGKVRITYSLAFLDKFSESICIFCVFWIQHFVFSKGILSN